MEEQQMVDFLSEQCKLEDSEATVDQVLEKKPKQKPLKRILYAEKISFKNKGER